MNFNNIHNLKNGKLKNCQICGSENLEAIISLGHQPPCDSLLWSSQLDTHEESFPLNLVRCSECSLVQIDFVVDPKKLFFPDYPYRSGITETLSRNLKSTGKIIVEKYKITKQSFIVDIGSNDGTLLSGFKDVGMKVMGVEPTNIAKIANEDNIPTIQSFFDKEVAKKIVHDNQKAKVVTAANMFAHVSQLDSLIKGVEILLEENGFFVTESHYVLDLLETLQYDSIYHEHLKYYSLHSIIKLFDYYNFTVIDVERIKNYGGSIRVFAQKGKNHIINDNIKKMLQLEKSVGIDKGKVFKIFAENVKLSKFNLNKLLYDIISNEKSIVGIGSPGRASTLLNYCNIDKDLIPYIAEQSASLKLGLHMPGNHIPIFDEKKMLEEQPDYALMLSWHYWEPIVKKLREKGLKSKIIIPLPEIIIV